jgi:hypothetical protein
MLRRYLGGLLNWRLGMSLPLNGERRRVDVNGRDIHSEVPRGAASRLRMEMDRVPLWRGNPHRPKRVAPDCGFDAGIFGAAPYHAHGYPVQCLEREFLRAPGRRGRTEFRLASPSALRLRTAVTIPFGGDAGAGGRKMS